MSLLEEPITATTSRTHMKNFRENAENEFVLSQFLMLLVCEVKLFIEKMPEILKEALDSLN